MGLDVYLYRYKGETPPNQQHTEAEAKEAEIVAALCAEMGCPDRWSDGFPKGRKDEYDAKISERRKSAGLDEYGGPNPETIRIDSKVYPGHYFKIGYLRSSYNSGGINNILRQRIDKDLYWVFEPNDDDSVVTPNWGECLKRAQTLRDEFGANLDEIGPYAVHEFFDALDPSRFDSSEKALATFQAERVKRGAKKDRTPGFDAYTNRDGTYYWEGLDVVAIYGGVKQYHPQGGKVAGVYVITRVKPDPDAQNGDTRHFAWYRQALEITCEMCEWVLSQPNPQMFALEWSSLPYFTNDNDTRRDQPWASGSQRAAWPSSPSRSKNCSPPSRPIGTATGPPTRVP